LIQRAAPAPLAHCRDGIVNLVLDCAADLPTVVADLLSGRYPLRVAAFNAARTGACVTVITEIAHEALASAVS
jgi:hypothetical protein